MKIPMKIIESKDNPLYKKLMASMSPRHAKKDRLIRVEGLRHVADVIESGIMPEYVFISNDLKGKDALEQLEERSHAQANAVSSQRVAAMPDYLFVRASTAKTPQGIMALVKLPIRSLSDFLESLCPRLTTVRLLLLEDVQDPGNVGTLIRTADAFAFDGIILTQTAASVCNPKTVAASMGSLFHLPLIETDRPLRDEIRLLKEHKFAIMGATLQGERSAREFPNEQRIALMLGHEGKGLSSEAIECADALIRIPIPGSAESLNVAAAGAIMMWELANQIPASRAEMIE